MDPSQLWILLKTSLKTMNEWIDEINVTPGRPEHRQGMNESFSAESL